MAFRKAFSEGLDQLQLDLDPYPNPYNQERSRQGYGTQGRTLPHAFLNDLSKPGRRGWLELKSFRHSDPEWPPILS